MLFLPMFIFFKMMYSQNDETGVLDVLEIRVFFRCPAAMVGNFLDNFLKILSVYFALW